MLAVSSLAVTLLYAGSRWWGSEGAKYGRKLYKPLELRAAVHPGHKLELRLIDPGWLNLRKLDDLQPDHGHLMHLYASASRIWTWPSICIPEQVQTGAFELALPPMPVGRYKLFADIVHASGLGETPMGDLNITDSAGTPLSGDNAGGEVTPGSVVSPMPDGTRMVSPAAKSRCAPDKCSASSSAWKTPPANRSRPGALYGHGRPCRLRQPDAARDRWTFAHIHPSGSTPMAALMMAAPPEAMAAMHQLPQGSDVSFPYAFPAPGQYRIFVQMKRTGTIETGAFDFNVN